ncbi:hypothetical protein LO909_001930 [Aeromonas hydrophila]|nr:hypothetical protein [Aeromonas hydrophila]
MLYEFFNCNGQLEPAMVKETLDTLNVKYSANQITSDFITRLIGELKTISPRDTFELLLDMSGNNTKVIDTSKDSLNSLLEHINDNDFSDEFEIELTVRKKVSDSTLSIYFLDSFFNGLIDEPLNNVLISLSKKINTCIMFEVFSTIHAFNSSGMIFFPSGTPPVNHNVTPLKKRQSQIEMFRDNCGAFIQDLNLLPSDFYLEVESENDSINGFFTKISSVLSLSYISSTLYFIADDVIGYKLNGYKTVVCKEIHISKIVDYSHQLYKIYAWAYEGGNGVDKLGLVRNILSIHLDGKGFIRFDTEAWEAIQSNYQVYLKDNIQSYLEIKNKIGEFIIDATTKTYIMADELLESLKNNFLVLLTFILTVVLVNGLKDNGPATVFSNSYLLVVIILSLVSAFWLVMSRIETMNRFESTTETIKEILRLNYDKVIMEEEIKNIVDPVIERNNNYLKKKLSRYTYWWVSMLVLFVLIFGIANRILAWTEKDLPTVDHVINITKIENDAWERAHNNQAIRQ